MQRIDLHQFPSHPRSTLWPLGHRDTPLRHSWRVSLSWKPTLRNTTTEGLREKKCSYAVDKLEYSSPTPGTRMSTWVDGSPQVNTADGYARNGGGLKSCTGWRKEGAVRAVGERGMNGRRKKGGWRDVRALSTE